MASSVLFYDNIVPLNRETHRDFRIDSRVERFGFARGSHVIPALVDEFVAAGIHLPIVFMVGTPEYVPVFLVGLRSGVNVMVSDDGRWTGEYVPAYLRRYPFIIGEVTGAEPLACVDQSDAGLRNESGTPMFDDQGKESQALVERVAFANDYYRAAVRNSAFIKLLTEMGLFRTVSIDARFDNGESVSIQGFLTVDADKLNSLSDDDFSKLRKAGYLPAIYAHLASLGCVDRIRKVL